MSIGKDIRSYWNPLQIFLPAWSIVRHYGNKSCSTQSKHAL